MESKSIFASKTFWLNLLSAGVTIATAFGLDLDLSAEEMATLAGSAVVLVNGVNIVLRLVTKQAVHIKAKE